MTIVTRRSTHFPNTGNTFVGVDIDAPVSPVPIPTFELVTSLTSLTSLPSLTSLTSLPELV